MFCVYWDLPCSIFHTVAVGDIYLQFILPSVTLQLGKPDIDFFISGNMPLSGLRFKKICFAVAHSRRLLVDMLRALKWPTTALFRASMQFGMDDP